MPDTVAETLKNFFNLGGSDMQETLPDRLSNMSRREKMDFLIDNMQGVTAQMVNLMALDMSDEQLDTAITNLVRGGIGALLLD